MTIALILLGVYAVTATLTLAYGQWRHRQRRPEIDLQRFWESGDATAERLQSVSAFMKAQHEVSPWYEKALSAVGVVTFVSMTVAAGIQTVRSSIETARADQLTTDIKRLEKDREELTTLVTEASATIVAHHEQFGRIDAASKRLLAHRLRLVNADSLSKPEDRLRTLKIAVLAEDYGMAGHILSVDPSLYSKLVMPDVLTIAEHFYLQGDTARSRLAVRKLADTELTGSLSVDQKFRAAGLRTALGWGKGVVAELRNEVDIRPQEIEDRVRREVRRLNNTRRNGRGDSSE